MGRSPQNPHGRNPTFEPGDDRSTTRAEYENDRSLARVKGFLLRGQAAQDEATAITSFAEDLAALGCDAYFGRLYSIAAEYSRTRTVSVRDVLGNMSSRLAAGHDAEKVLASYARRLEDDCSRPGP